MRFLFWLFVYWCTVYSTERAEELESWRGSGRAESCLSDGVLWHFIFISSSLTNESFTILGPFLFRVIETVYHFFSFFDVLVASFFFSFDSTMVVCISESSLRQRSAQWKERDTRRSLSNERLSAIDLWVPFDCKSGAFCRVRDATKRTTIAWIVERFVWNARVRRLTPNETHKKWVLKTR